ncbi:MAG TPA: putative Ig domain-containing protein [Ohtaekwangia sp.]|uniref:putative Ig domain-containing protein n=1 Tax=Ohtaekwangia sp. TaxID=2066019 RepID=UPI002F935A18
MKKSLFTLLAFALCLFSLPGMAQPGEPGCSVIYDSIVGPLPPTAFVGDNLQEQFRAMSNGVYYDNALYNLEYGDLPPGLALDGDILSGIFTTAGNYTFAIGANGGPECPTVLREYTINVSWNRPCSNFKLYAPYGESGFHLVGVTEYVGICLQEPFDSVSYTELSLPPNFTTHLANSCIEAWGPPTDTGTYSISIAASVPNGCRDTLTMTHHWGCVKVYDMYPLAADLLAAHAKVGEPYSGHFAAEIASYEIAVPFQFDIVSGALPPGLTLDETGTGAYDVNLVGTPATPGTYTFTMRARLGAMCTTIEQEYTMIVDENDLCADFNIDAIYGESGHAIVGEQEYYGICSVNSQEDSIAYTVLGLPNGYSIQNYTPGNPCIEVWGAAVETGPQSIIIAATASTGCRDTLTITNNYQCTTLERIAPYLPNLPEGAVSHSYNQRFYIEYTPFSLGIPFHFAIAEGTLPPGLTLTDTLYMEARLRGIPTTAGAYTFTLRASLGTCAVVDQHYTLVIEDSVDCSNFHIGVVYAENTYGIAGIPEYYNICSVSGPDPVQYTAVSLLPGYTLTSDIPCADLNGAVMEAGTFSMKIAAQSSLGCSDTLTISNTWHCLDGSGFDPTELPIFTVGQSVNEGFRSPSYQNFGAPMTYVVTDGTLPSGLTLQAGTGYTDYDAYLTGQPTTPGIYTFTIRAYLGNNCAGTEQTYTVQVKNAAAPKPLILTPQCADSIATRRWTIYNPNDVSVFIDWELLYATNYHGSLVANPGYTLFSTPNIINPNSIKITWDDGITGIKTLVRGASSELCNPPACVVAATVISYHQGLQKDGFAIPAIYSDATQALGEPDANDTPSPQPKYFSLGYSGFIVLQLSSNLSDQAGNDLIVHETSYGDPSFSSHPERAEVFASQNGSQWVSLGFTGSSQYCNEPIDHAFDLSGKIAWCRYIKIVDKTDRHAKILSPVSCLPTNTNAFNETSNGFDVDAVTCGSYTEGYAARVATAEASAIFSGNANAIYPNPVTDRLTVSLSEDDKFILPDDRQIRLDIRDVSGRMVYQQLHTLDAGWKTQCDVSSFPTGVFILRARTHDTVRYYKFIKN